MKAGRRIALLFPGHGSEHPAMARDLLGDAGGAKWIDLASQVAGIDSRRLLRRGGPAFHDTRVVQPLLTAICVAWLEELCEAGFEYDFVVGHSLGELTAWHASGAMSGEEAVELGARRGALLGEIADRRPGAMWSWRGSSEQREQLELSRPDGVIDLAVHNAPEFWVYSGDAQLLAEWLGARGGRRLESSGPWHCRWMREGEPRFEGWVREVDGPRTRARIICNHQGQLREIDEDFVEPFVSQMSGTVQFASAMSTLAELEAQELVMVGPTKVLRALIRDNWGERAHGTRLWRLESRRDLEALLRCRDGGWPEQERGA